MGKSGIIFSDLEGTLVFREGIVKIKDYGSGACLVYDTKTQKKEIVYDCQHPTLQLYLSCTTQAEAQRLREEHGYLFVYATATRQSSMEAMSACLNFADAFILDNGGLILDADYRQDPVWAKMLEPEKKSLEEMKRYLKGEGWNLDDKGKTGMVRVKKSNNPEKSDEKFEKLIEMQLPPELKITRNLGHVDILVRSAGKDKAAAYLMEKYGARRGQTIGIGDDINDLPMLELVGKAYVLGSSHPEVISRATERGWYISREGSFDSIDEILYTIITQKLMVNTILNKKSFRPKYPDSLI